MGISHKPVTVRRFSAALASALIVAAVAACGSTSPTASASTAPAATSPAPVQTATPPASATPGTSATPTTSASISASSSASPSATDGGTSIGFHSDTDLEDLLPSKVSTMDLVKISLPLSSYLQSVSGADKDLYTTWLTKLGVSADNSSIAAALGGTEEVPFRIVAFRFRGADPDKVFTAFRESLTANNWPFTDKLIATKLVTEATDPSNDSVGDVYVKNGIAYVILANTPALVAETLILLP